MLTTAMAALCLTAVPGVETAHATDSTPQHVQLIGHQKTVAAGGTASYHILYHNAKTEKLANARLVVEVPDGFDLDAQDIGSAKWDESKRTLVWNLRDIDANSSRVLHFQLKVKSSVAGSWEELSCRLEVDGELIAVTPKVKCKVGTQIDQPFFQGYPDGLFHPERHITRAEVAAVIAREKDLTESSGIAYADVTADHWAHGYIDKVTRAGYMNGYGDGSFHPDAPITRAELVKVALAMRGIHALPLKGFDDTADHWANRIIGTAKELAFIDGVGDGRFHPNASTERRAAAKLFNIALFRGPLKDGMIPVQQHFPDVTPDDWEFEWVEEASMEAHESLHKGRGIERLVRYLPDQTEEM